MSCDEVLAMLDAWVDGELDAAHSLQIEAHLAGCAACDERVRQIKHLRVVISGAQLRAVAPAALRERVRASLAEAEAPPPQRRVSDRTAGAEWTIGLWHRIAPLGWAAALLMAIGLAIVLINSRPTDGTLLAELVQAHARSLLADHLLDVVSTNQHTVKPWLSRRLDFSPPVRDLAAHGYPLVGGRLDYIAGRPVAVLVYQHSDSHEANALPHVINLFIWPEQGPDESFAASSRNGYQVLGWRQKQMRFELISDMSEARLHDLAALVQSDNRPN